MSAVACTLSIGEVDEISDALNEQHAAIVRLLSEFDAFRNGVTPDTTIVSAALGRLATAVTTIQDTIELRTMSEAKDERSGSDG